MRTGDLDRRILIETPTDGQDGFGAPTQTWAPLHGDGYHYARYMSLKVAEVLSNRAEQATSTAIWRTHWMPNLDTKCRITDEFGVVWTVKGAVPIGQREWLEITAEASNV